MKVPFELTPLDTCLPDYFLGFSGPVISFPVDARMTYSELIAQLTDDDAWPGNADMEDIRAAVIDLVGQVHYEGRRPYPDIGPDEEPRGIAVRRHPTISDIWLLIDKDDYDVISSHPTEGEALLEAWDAADEEYATVYAYFSIELDWPEGYSIVDEQSGNDHYWTWRLAPEEGGDWSNQPEGPCFDTEMEAKVAAWRHKLEKDDFRGVAESYEELHEGLSDMVEEGRLTETDLPDDYHWLVESLAHLSRNGDTK